MRHIKRFALILAALMLVFCFVGCGGSQVTIDYADAESFEAALNNGKNLEGKVVQFTADELHPQSAYGYNIWAGEHLNFISSRNPDVEVGSTVVVKATTIESISGSWFISYEKVDNAVVGENTISATNTVEVASFSSASSSSNSKSTETPKALKLVDASLCDVSGSSYSDTVYINYCGIIKNPNTSKAATFPKIYATVKNGSEILTTDSQTGFYIMPGDTIALVGMLSVPKSEVTSDTVVHYSVECSDFVTAENSDMVKSSDFEVSNVSEHSASYSHTVTGEITNNSNKTVDMAYVTVVMTKDGEIAYAQNTFVDGMSVGGSKAFELSSFDNFPEHDDIKVYVQEW